MNTLILTAFGLADSPQDGSVQSSKFPALLWRGEGGRNDDDNDNDDDDDDDEMDLFATGEKRDERNQRRGGPWILHLL